MFEEWSVGLLDYWITGVLDYWIIGLLEEIQIKDLNLFSGCSQIIIPRALKYHLMFSN